MEYHKLFEAQYQELEQAVDEIAERIGKLGGNTIGSMEEFLKYGTLKESAGQYPTSKEMLTQLLKDHEAVAIALRKAIEKCDEEYDDVGTVDFLTTLLEHHESTAWMLRRYLS
jgi:starvation-inducible DNA-binding protein